MTRGAGLFGAPGTWTLIEGSVLRASAPCALSGCGPGPLALIRSSPAGALVPQSYKQIVSGGACGDPKYSLCKERQPRAGRRGLAKEWRPRLCVGPKLMQVSPSPLLPPFVLNELLFPGSDSCWLNSAQLAEPAAPQPRTLGRLVCLGFAPVSQTRSGSGSKSGTDTWPRLIRRLGPQLWNRVSLMLPCIWW